MANGKGKGAAKKVGAAVTQAVHRAMRKHVPKKTQQGRKHKPGKKKAGKPRSKHHMGYIMSPLVPAMVPSLTFQGEAFPVGGITRCDLSIQATDRVLIFVTNTGVSGTIMQRLQWNASAGGATAIDAKQSYTIPTLALSDTAGGPTSMRAMKCGLTITCRTPLLDRGGLVYVLNTSQRIRAVALPDAVGATPGLNRGQADGFFNSIVAHPSTKVLDWADFGKPRHLFSHVVDDPRYNDFDENKGTIDNNTFFQHIALGGDSIPLDRPMSTIILAIDLPTKAQNVNLTAHATFYSRWPLDTVPGQAQTKIPVTTHDKHNDIHSSASDHSKLDPGFVQAVENAASSLGKDAYSVAADLAGMAMRRRARVPRIPPIG